MPAASVHFFPFRRTVILQNLRRVYGDTASEKEIVALAQAHYGHLWRLACEFVQFRWLSPERKAAMVRVENYQAFAAALSQGKGVLILTGHFGNWEVGTIAGLAKYPSFRGRFHFVRAPLKRADSMRNPPDQSGGSASSNQRGSPNGYSTSWRGDAIAFRSISMRNPRLESEFSENPAGTAAPAIIALAG